MDLNSHRSEIEQFLFDLRDHLIYSIEPTEYENTVSLFGDNSEHQNRKFIERCEKILGYFSDSSNNNHKRIQNGFSTPIKNAKSTRTRTSLVQHVETEEISYLEMSVTPPKKSVSTEYIDFQEQKPIDIRFQPEEGQHAVEEDDDDDDDEENKILDKGIYDICNESPQFDEGLKSLQQESENIVIQDCPYAGLPASHMSIQKSTKFGQLQRIEKRLFFGQSKKCYCGILNDWLLCYCDGVTAMRPTFSIHLKAPGVEVEHHGEGKRREICFQITDPSKKHVFQCNTEVEAKEWIHAVEAAIRGDSPAQLTTAKTPRKLPTPPTLKKTYETNSRNCINNDCIYEEPSPLYNMHQPTELLIEQKTADEQKMVPDIPEKQKSMLNISKKFDYDIPKSPPPPVNAESETAELLHISRNNSDFQNKVKDVHSKLTSQLSTRGPSPECLKKIAKKSLSESEPPALSPQQTPTTKEQKKANKSAQKLSKTPNQEKSSRNWFLNRLNKSTSSTRSSATSPTKCKQSEKENLLNNLEICDGYESEFISPTSNGASSVKGSKVNMIINQLEASGHLAMFGVEAFNGGHSEGKLSSFCDSDCNNYEPIMTGPSSFMKKV